MYFVGFLVLYGLGFALGLEYLGWPFVALWLVGFFVFANEMCKFVLAVRTSSNEAYVNGEL
ncbi:hypothetical protein [Cohaesibacter celericrescens]|uniref:Uncharacterized protein n=1 Tax=Cohaesibacter celericrescens TaxID=2067669 RepID=A0A2N5XVZ7_9HYPH|nr:hypothetical protein [Cohaesibacter celericrescens]PLW78669.1 hypothetical protein C0081_03550 [Cohaesibacter celericrescens]